MNLHSIKFAVEVDARLLNPDHSLAANIKGHKVLDWGLGKGPCGRWVAKLSAEIDMATIRVTQESYSRDRSADLDRVDIATYSLYRKNLSEIMELQMELRADRKIETFVYKLEDVRGRIKALQKG